MITNMTAHSMCCRLSREPVQVGHAREQARQALLRWGLGEHADLAELIVSELATNAVAQGTTQVSRPGLAADPTLRRPARPGGE